jgi:hypothetical protein
VSVTLAQYISQTQFFLRDKYGTTYQQSDLINCINQARANVASDSFVTRALVTIPTISNEPQYQYTTVLNALMSQGYPTAAAVVWIQSIAVYWSATLKVTLDYMEWTDLNAIFASFLNFTFIPSVWADYAIAQSFYVYPIPNSNYTLEIDCIYLPNVLVNTTDVDLLPASVADLQLVPYLAASIAKLHQNAYGESQWYARLYAQEFERRFSGYPSHRVASRYGTDVRSP